VGHEAVRLGIRNIGGFTVWKRFWRLSRSGTLEAFFDALAAMSAWPHLWTENF
jgi:hypothetical protein